MCACVCVCEASDLAVCAFVALYFSFMFFGGAVVDIFITTSSS